MNKTWPCEHITYSKWIKSWRYAESLKCNNWSVCPYENCGAKRPDEPKKLWEKIQMHWENNPYGDRYIVVSNLAKDEFLRMVDKLLVINDPLNKMVDLENIRTLLKQKVQEM